MFLYVDCIWTQLSSPAILGEVCLHFLNVCVFPGILPKIPWPLAQFHTILKVKNQLDATKYAWMPAYFVAYSWFFTFTMSTMHGQMNIKFHTILFVLSMFWIPPCKVVLFSHLVFCWFLCLPDFLQLYLIFHFMFEPSVLWFIIDLHVPGVSKYVYTFILRDVNICITYQS
jgi:hypothetical protein